MAEDPAPLVPIEVDLRDYDFMPLDTDRLRDSDLSTYASGDEFKAAVLLWCASWHQVPASSIPKNDQWLAKHSGSGPRWARLKDGAMRGFVLCSDGRWYHPVVSEKALEAWAKHKRASSKGKAGASKRWGTGNSTGNGTGNSRGNGTGNASAIGQLMPGDSNGEGHGTLDSGANNGRRRKQRLPATGVPETFEVTPDMADWAMSRGLPADAVENETLKFLNHHKGKGSLQADWPATWRSWILKAVEYRGARH